MANARLREDPTYVAALELFQGCMRARVRRGDADVDVTTLERPLCLASGRCCRFEAHGHRLYVTGLEVAWFLDRLAVEEGRALEAAAIDAAVERGDCPFLEGGRCTVHAIRPFGCRSYFCDPRAGWQAAAYERWHARVRALHDERSLPYAYGEWRAMLRSVLAS